MHISEHLAQAKRPLLSFEIVPPARGHTITDLLEVVQDLVSFHPSWIDVTSHAPYAEYSERQDGSVTRSIYKKRPGTLGICGVIQNRFKVDTVAHLLCLGFTREETEDALIELNYLGVHNVLALRGDGPNFQKKHDTHKTHNRFAVDLVDQIVALRRGEYLSDLSGAKPMDFCVGVAGYPEKHFEAPNLSTDIEFLKAKVATGATYIVTQMFFDNEKYKSFVQRCRLSGITVPIVPGLKVLQKLDQITSIPRNFYCDLPEDLVAEVRAHPDHVREIGIQHALMQAQDLLSFGIPSLHFYVLNDTRAVSTVLKKLKL